MRILSSAWVADLKTLVFASFVDEYEELTKDMWWQLVAKERPSETETERLIWLLDEARIRETTIGSITFDRIRAMSQELTHSFAANGLKLSRPEMLDVLNGIPGGKALDAAGHWARQMAQLAAYWPQEKVADAMLANPVGYDSKPLFALDHPLNPFRPSLGVYANRMTGAASGIFPGAVPIHSGTIDEARENVSKVLAYAASIKTPNGKHPRKLRAAAMLVPPALTSRADLITGAETLPMAAGSAAGSADMRPIKRRWGLPDPVQCDEIGSAMGGSDTTWYLVMKGVEKKGGALVYTNREGFQTRYHGPDTDAQLAVIDEVQFTTVGRNGVAAGHPYLVIRCEGT